MDMVKSKALHSAKYTRRLAHEHFRRIVNAAQNNPAAPIAEAPKSRQKAKTRAAQASPSLAAA